VSGLEWIALAVSSLGTTAAAATSLYLGTYALAFGGLLAVSRLLVQKPSVPKPEDGSYNLKQNVPSDAFVMGWAKKGGDYAFLEETDGDAYHVIVQASHRIEGYIQHYLHDEKITIGPDGVITAPEHFDNNILIKERVGLNAETAYDEIVTAFPDIYTADHRGDGLASVFMKVIGTTQKNFMKIFPNNMPELSSVIAGMRLYDPRTETTAFSRNLPLMRFWHATSPVGLKLTLDDMYLPEWEHAADVGDEDVTNRDGETEKRYHGGFWFRSNNDPVEVGRIMDQAAELVVYERPDGLVGVHAGEFVEPDIVLTADSVISFTLDGNTRDTSNVLAVRGRYTRLDLDYNQSDAAVYGDPYADETERSKTIDNQAIQSHNHVQRLQKIAFIRANAPRVSVVAHYEAAENVPYRRFVRVNIPPKLDDVIVEITETPRLSLRNLTIAFSGIIVPANLYDFDAATEEGVPGNDVIPVEAGGVPTPEGFDVEIRTDTVSGTRVPYGFATWDHESGKLTYELEWQPTDLSEPPRSIMSEEDEDEVRSGYLNDGEEYRFRLRAWGGGSYSEWTDYVIRTAVADPTAPAALSSFLLTSTSNLGRAQFEIRTANDGRLRWVNLYRVAAGAPFDPDTETPINTGPIYAGPSSTYPYVDGNPTPISNLLSNSDFASDTVWTKGSGWTIASGVATKAAGAIATISQAMAVALGQKARISFTVSGYSAGAVRSRIAAGGTQNDGADRSANGTYRETLTASVARDTFSLRADAAFVGSVDNVIAFIETATCAPQGVWDYYAVPFNASGVKGPVSGPVAATII